MVSGIIGSNILLYYNIVMSDKNHAKRKLYSIYFLIAVICVVVALFMGGKFVSRVLHFGPPVPRETNVALIQDWMTIPYISRTYGVPVEVFSTELNLEEGVYRRMNIDGIAKKRNMPSAQLIEQLQQIIVRFQSEHQNLPQR